MKINKKGWVWPIKKVDFNMCHISYNTKRRINYKIALRTSTVR